MHGYLLILLTKAINHLSYVGWSLGRKLQPPTSCPSLSSLKGTMLVLVGQNQNSSWSKCHKWNKPWSNRGASISAWSHQKKTLGTKKAGYIADPICGATSTSAIDPLGLQARMPGCKTAHASSEASRCGHEANSSRRGASMGYSARWSCKAQHIQWKHRIYRFAWKIITIWPLYYITMSRYSRDIPLLTPWN